MRFFLVIIVFLQSGILFGQEVHILKKSDGVISIGTEIQIYHDENASLTVKDILGEKIQKQFVNSDVDVPIFNITTANIWIKISLTTEESEKWCMSWGMPSAQYITLYKIKDGKVQKLKSGIRIPAEQRIMMGHSVIFDLGLKKGEKADYYFMINDITPLRAIIKVGAIEDFFRLDHKINFWHGAYYGVMLLMAMYNLFLFVTNRKRVYLYYVFYVLSCAIFIAFFSGYLNLFSDNFLWLFIYIPVLFPAGMGIFGLLFTMDFLYTKKHTPVMHKVMIVFCFTVTLPLLLCLFGEQRMSVMIIQILGLMLGVICISTGIKVLWKGYKPAKFYVIGFGAYMGGLMLLITNDLLGMSTEFISVYGLEIGSAIEAVMLSFAIGDKLNNANKEKDAAREEALAGAKENERLVSEQNVFLEKKVKERTAEINEQKEIIEEKQKEIVDSINYAKRIQYTILAHDELLKKNLPEHFVLFKPKDIVSGDFYWATGKSAIGSGSKQPEEFYLAVCDSTGHGVPGAFMSLLNTSYLNEAINEKNIAEPGIVFDHVRKRLIENLSQEGGQDGMDGILVKFNSGKQEIEYAAANNAPIVIRNREIIDLPYDKMPIGKGDHQNDFQNFTFNLQKGDLLYLLTDGYADQFGGPKGKKLKHSNLQKMLLENSHLELSALNIELLSAFENWRGDLEQVDDVCIIGIRI